MLLVFELKFQTLMDILNGSSQPLQMNQEKYFHLLELLNQIVNNEETEDPAVTHSTSDPYEILFNFFKLHV